MDLLYIDEIQLKSDINNLQISQIKLDCKKTDTSIRDESKIDVSVKNCSQIC